jgi:hypothetical protein
MEKIQAMFVLEILGKPASHVESSIHGIVEKLGNEDGVSIISKIIHDPIKAKNSETMFTTFAEIDLEFKSIENYLSTLFAYMPSNAEIIRPEKLNLTNVHFGEISSVVIQRLHQYDSLTKRAMIDKDVVLKRLKEVNPEEHKKLTTPPEEKDA